MQIRRCLLLLTFFCIAASLIAPAEQDPSWDISPAEINIQLGESCPLQALDTNGKEVAVEDWWIDNTGLADISREDGRTVVYAKAPGEIKITAMIAGEIRTRRATIWPYDKPVIGFEWSASKIGKDIDIVQAVPTTDGPDVYSLSNNGSHNYIRAFSVEGAQRWIWTIPDTGHTVDLVCGDSAGGIILSVTRTDSFILYDLAKDGTLHWQHTFRGTLRGYTLGYSAVLLLLTQTADRTGAVLTGLDEEGSVKFEVTLPQSHQTETDFRRSGKELFCSPGYSRVVPQPMATSGLFTDTDGEARMAFTQTERIAKPTKCTPDSIIGQSQITYSTTERLILWQVRPDGTWESHVVEEIKHTPEMKIRSRIASPTGGIIPDGLGGVLLSVTLPNSIGQAEEKQSRDAIYRIGREREIVFRFRLPLYTGPRYDAMVLGEQDQGFAIRGRQLIAFNLHDGSEVWHWNARTSNIEISMSTAGGGCLVDTPQGLVLVKDGSALGVVAPAGSVFYISGNFLRKNPVGLWRSGQD